MRKQANSHGCYVCGLENPFGLKLKFYWDGPERVVCNHVVPEHFNGYPGIVHGGVVATMLDELVGRVFIGDPPDLRFLYTAKLTVRYRKSVPTGQPLHMVATAVRDRGRMAEAKAELYGPDGELLVEADGLLVEMPEEMYKGYDLEDFGWKVYPDEEENL